MNTQFSEIFEHYNLLKHPFYLAWNEGKLTRDQLALYAGEYGSFINLISKGWQQTGEEKIANEEAEHFILWQQFAASIGSKSIEANLLSSKQLLNTTEDNYKTYAGALGALYAFEKQQPATAASKLEGLRKHYSNWNADETYFKVHEHDLYEPALLEEKINMLNHGDKLIAQSACAASCEALWNALSGIMNHDMN